MSKAYGRFVTGLFCLFLGGMLVWSLLTPDRERSETENRTLAQWPEFSWDELKSGKFTAGVEKYFSDQFPLRDQWTGLKARSEQLLGKREFHGVYLCENETLIARVEAPEDDLAEKNLDYVKKLSEKTDISVYLGLIPSAAEVWQSKLPTGADSFDQAAFLELAAETGLPMVDFDRTLSARSGEDIFYRTDHHWTTLGAYYGYTAVMEALGRGEDAPGVEAFDRRTYPHSDQFNGTLYSTSGVHWLTPDTIEYWADGEGVSVTSWRSGTPEAAALYDFSYLDTKDKYSSFLGGNQPLCVIENEDAPGGGKLLLVRDSYSDALAPFLAQSFSEVHLLDLRYYRASAAAYAEEHGIDNILVLYSVPNFIEDKNLVFLGQ